MVRLGLGSENLGLALGGSRQIPKHCHPLEHWVQGREKNTRPRGLRAHRVQGVEAESSQWGSRAVTEWREWQTQEPFLPSIWPPAS